MATGVRVTGCSSWTATVLFMEVVTPEVGDMSCFPDETSDVMSFFSGATMPPVGDILR